MRRGDYYILHLWQGILHLRGWLTNLKCIVQGSLKIKNGHSVSVQQTSVTRRSEICPYYDKQRPENALLVCLWGSSVRWQGRSRSKKLIWMQPTSFFPSTTTLGVSNFSVFFFRRWRFLQCQYPHLWSSRIRRSLRTMISRWLRKSLVRQRGSARDHLLVSSTRFGWLAGEDFTILASSSEEVYIYIVRQKCSLCHGINSKVSHCAFRVLGL